jgi:hypothetical protein
MLEKRLAAVSPQSFIINGGSDGSVTVNDTSLFKVKQEVILSASSLSNLDQIEVKRIVSPNVMYVGPKGGNIDSRIDVSAYTVALGATIFANEQKRPSIPFEEFTRAVYEEEPVVAQRSVLVDKYGNKYDNSNPMPVNATVSIGDVQVDLNGFSSLNPDSVQIVGSEDGTKTGVKHSARVDSELDLRVGISDGDNKAVVSSSGKLQVSDSNIDVQLSTVAKDSTLLSIDGKLNSLGQKTSTASMPVVIASDQSAIPIDLDSFSSTPDNVMTVGSQDGTKTGTKFGTVYNRRQQVLAAHDRIDTYTYADFGTKNQRITRVEYTSSTFPGTTIRRDFNYVLDGNRYRRINSPWTVV